MNEKKRTDITHREATMSLPNECKTVTAIEHENVVSVYSSDTSQHVWTFHCGLAIGNYLYSYINYDNEFIEPKRK